MLIAICAKNKQAFINGKCPRPAATSNELPIWERCNAIVLSWIMNSFSKEIFSGFVYSTNATVVWNDLKERFDKINGSRIFSLHREIESLLQGTNSVSVCYSKLRQLWDEFASLVILPTCQCEYARRYVEYDQQHHLLQFLMGLNDSYTSIRNQILKMSPLPSVGHAFTIISQEESHRSISAAAVYPVDTSASAFFSSRDRFDDRRRNSVKCEYCNLPGHTKSVCYRLVGYPPHHKLYKSKFNKGNTVHPKDAKFS